MDILELDDSTRLTSSRFVKTSDVNLKTCHVLWRIELIGESESGKSMQSARPDDDLFMVLKFGEKVINRSQKLENYKIKN